VLTLSQRFNDQGEVDEGDEHHVELLESREDASESLQASEQPLYLVAPLVHLTIVLPSADPIALGRNHRNEIQIKG